MTTEAYEVTTTDELRHLFVGGVGHVSVLCGHVETARGRPIEVTTTDELRHLFVGGVRTCFRVLWTCGNCEGTLDDHRSSRGDDLRHLFVGGVCGGHVSPRCFVDTWKLRGDAR